MSLFNTSFIAYPYALVALLLKPFVRVQLKYTYWYLALGLHVANYLGGMLCHWNAQATFSTAPINGRLHILGIYFFEMLHL